MNNIVIFEFTAYPSHTQAVERYIPIVSNTSKCISDPIERVGRIFLYILLIHIM